MSDVNFEIYQSPFSWRYGSEKMRQIFSEHERRKTWRKIWVALARAQYKAGLLTKEELSDIEKNASKIDIKKSLEVEKIIYHDLMAEVKTFAQGAKVGGGKIHLGATSTDITDNADILIISQALLLSEGRLKNLLKSFSKIIEKYKAIVCMGYTHLQPAEPTTLGYRLSLYAQDLLNDLKLLRFFKENLKAKGIKGAVGTSASYQYLLKNKKIDAQSLNLEVVHQLGLLDTTVCGQTYPRKQDLHLMFVLSSIAQSLYKFCFDLRIMQSPNFGQYSEPRSEHRIGSSAMPFKRNPDKAEKICSLARFVAVLISTSWENAANSLLERTLDDSANRRIYIPEAFLAVDEILIETNKLVDGLVVFEENIKSDLLRYGPFSATEKIMMEAAKRGANRQELHERIRQLSMKAWEQVNKGLANPLVDMLKKDKIITTYIKEKEIDALIDPAQHIGLAQDRCLHFLKELRLELTR